MIQRMSEEWERIGDSLQRRESMEVEELSDVLRAVRSVRDAIREVARVSVTRANFRAAVQEAVEALVGQPGRLQPAPGEGRAEAPGAPAVLAPVPPDLAAKLTSFETRVAALSENGEALRAAMDGVGDRIHLLESRLGSVAGDVTELRELLARRSEESLALDSRVGAVEGRFETLDSRIRQVEQALGAGAERADLLESRLHMVVAELGEAQFRVTEVDGRGAEAHVALGALRHSLDREVASLLGDVQATRRAQAAEGEVQTARWRALQSQVSQGLEGVETAVQGVRAEVLQLLARLEGSLPEVVRSHSGELEARLRRDVAATAQHLAGLISKVEAAWPEALTRRTRELAGAWGEQLEASTRGMMEALGRVEAAFPGLLEKRTTEVETGLRQELHGAVSDMTAQWVELRNTLQLFVSQLEERLQLELRQVRDQTETRLRDGVGAVEAKIVAARGELERLLTDLEASVPVVAGQKAGEAEARLRKELDFMLAKVAEQLAGLRALLSSVGEGMPRREAVEEVKDRLGRVEEGLGRVAQKVDNIDSLSPEIAGMGARFSEVRAELAALATRLGLSGEAVESLHAAVVDGQGELQALVHSGIQRWETDQSHMLERLSAIRDTLRDQLRSLGDRVEVAQQGGLLARLTGRREGSVKLSRDEWDHVSTKLEGIISGLESILAKKQKTP